MAINEEQIEKEIEETKEELEETTEDASPTPRELELMGRLKRAETKLEKLKVDQKVEKKVEVELEKKIGELDNADYALLATKGIDDDDPRIDYIKEKMIKWKMPLRELLKDEDIKAKLRSLKIEGDVKNATPSSTRRSSGGDSDKEDYFYQKYISTDTLPDNMPSGMAEKLVNRRYASSNPRQNPFD